jgi:hypothetical protein
MLAALAFGAAVVPAAAQAQRAAISQTISGTRLDVSATGDVTRVPDIAIISAGVVTKAPTAQAALQQTAARMEKVRAALTAAGVADRDIQTSNISLNPEYRYQENQSPQLTGYTASNEVSVRFRNLSNAGKILDALVAQGANQINGPTLTIDNTAAALDEARGKAIAAGRARAEMYARQLGMRVVRLLAVSENGGDFSQPIMVTGTLMRAAAPRIDPGEQKLQVNLAMTFELQ